MLRHLSTNPPTSPSSQPPIQRSTLSLSRHDAGSRWGDGGQGAVFVVTVAAVLLVAMVVGLATMGRTAVDRTRAQTAADAAALAALDGGRSAAADLAQRHGASVVAWDRGPGPFEVTITVRIGDTTATARASNAP